MFWSKRSRKRQESAELVVHMDPVELSQLLAILYAVQPTRFLEWGAGGSTRVILERCPFIERYVAIEHDEAWWSKVRASIKDPRLDLRLVPPDRPLTMKSPSREDMIAWEATGEHDEGVFKNYVAAPVAPGVVFDAVLVDGRARRFCIRHGFELLRPGGLLLLHDAQRSEYHDALRDVGEPLFLDAWKQGQLALVRKKDP